ncbi:MAG: hypothetical protein MZV64_19475 [Ignavibacteriales bacterium]|nr:hypothetical protein [Ignavibacteriales bacterium]
MPPSRSAPSPASKPTVDNAAKSNMASPPTTTKNSSSTGVARIFYVPPIKADSQFAWLCSAATVLLSLAARLSRRRSPSPNRPASKKFSTRSSCYRLVHRRSCLGWDSSSRMASGSHRRAPRSHSRIRSSHCPLSSAHCNPPSPPFHSGFAKLRPLSVHRLSKSGKNIDLPILRRATLAAATFAFTVSARRIRRNPPASHAPNTPPSPIAIERFLSQPGGLNYGQAHGDGDPSSCSSPPPASSSSKNSVHPTAGEF